MPINYVPSHMKNSENMSLEDMEKKKVPRGEVALVGLGRLGVRTALNLIQVQCGGPDRIIAIDGQKISSEDLIFKMLGGKTGDYKVNFLEKFAGHNNSREISAIPEYISSSNLNLIQGDVVCIEIAGGDTIPLTASIINHAQKSGACTISTMGVFGIGEEEIKVVEIDEADPENPIVSSLIENGVKNHLLVGTGKLIRDWEPITPYVLDRISHVMTSEILKLLEIKKQ